MLSVLIHNKQCHDDWIGAVWERIKERAIRFNDACVGVSMADARIVVRAICNDELISRAEPPPDAMEYLASELVPLAAEAAEVRSALPLERGSPGWYTTKPCPGPAAAVGILT